MGARSKEVTGRHLSIALAAKHAPGCDAAVTVVSCDTGLRATRERFDIAVAGMLAGSFFHHITGDVILTWDAIGT